MNTILIDLKKLQDVDDQVKIDRKSLDEGQAKLNEAAFRLKGFEDRLAAAEKDLLDMGTRHRAMEAEVVDLSAKKTKNEAKQEAVSSSNQYDALLKEADFLSKRISQLEDDILDLLARIEKREVEIINLKALVSEDAANYAKLAAEVDKIEKDSHDRLSELGAIRQTLLDSIPPAYLKRYSEIASVRAGKAVSPAGNGLCLACRLGFPPQLYNELQRNEKILNCPNCNRIIYWENHPDFQVPEPQPDQAQAS